MAVLNNIKEYYPFLLISSLTLLTEPNQESPTLIHSVHCHDSATERQNVIALMPSTCFLPFIISFPL